MKNNNQKVLYEYFRIGKFYYNSGWQFKKDSDNALVILMVLLLELCKFIFFWPILLFKHLIDNAYDIGTCSNHSIRKFINKKGNLICTDMLIKKAKNYANKHQNIEKLVTSIIEDTTPNKWVSFSVYKDYIVYDRYVVDSKTYSYTSYNASIDTINNEITISRSTDYDSDNEYNQKVKNVKTKNLRVARLICILYAIKLADILPEGETAFVKDNHVTIRNFPYSYI